MTPEALKSWRKISAHVNGMVVASSLLALRRHGLLTGQRLRLGDLPGNPGYLHGLFRALDSLGWVDRQGAAGSPDLHVQWTASGQTVVEAGDWLERVPGLLESALDLAEGDFSHWPDLDLPAGPMGQMLEGHLVGPTVLGLLLRSQEELPEGPRRLLQRLQWLDEAGSWTAEGDLARRQGAIYHYPISYLSTILRVEELLFGDPLALRQRNEAGEESHVDRRRDILFSGQVFAGSVGPVIWDLFLPLVSGERRPSALVDVGCGDGLMLVELGRRAPGTRLIGVEYNPVACQVAGERLAEFPGSAAIAGDIADPARLDRDLRALGVDPAEALFVTKSVVHNRPFRAPVRSGQPSASSAAVADPEGQVIDNTALEQNLVEFFESWAPLIRGFGFLVVEAHTVPPAVARQHAGRTLAPALDLSHCLSGQMLVEADLFRACAERAGLRSSASRELGAAAFGHNHMTIDHFLPVG